MAKKYYLTRTVKDGFLYARGLPFAEESIKGLALVRIDLYKDLDFKGDWSIIDIPSGLSVYTSHTKKRVIEFWTRNSDTLIEKIAHAREGEIYNRIRIPEMKIEKKNWRESGYSVED